MWGLSPHLPPGPSPQRLFRPTRPTFGQALTQNPRPERLPAPDLPRQPLVMIALQRGDGRRISAGDGEGDRNLAKGAARSSLPLVGRVPAGGGGRATGAQRVTTPARPPHKREGGGEALPRYLPPPCGEGSRVGSFSGTAPPRWVPPTRSLPQPSPPAYRPYPLP
jgi:hypothetical protein